VLLPGFINLDTSDAVSPVVNKKPLLCATASAVKIVLLKYQIV